MSEQALYGRVIPANAALGGSLAVARAQAGIEAQTISRAVLILTAAALVSLLSMLVLGGRVARTISRPLTELRETMVRQRNGEPGARAREDRGSSELRSLAREINALTERTLFLQQTQVLALDTQRITFEIARAIRGASDTQQALDVMCTSLGEGLGVDRVVADTLGPDHQVLLGAQWHRPELPPLADRLVLPEVEALAEEPWQSTGFQAQEDLLEESASSRELSRAFLRDTGSRGVVMAPIGLNDRVIGMIYVLALNPRMWTTSEVNVVQTVSGFVARAIEHQANQREHLDRIERLDRQKSDFLATVSHELRTPLTSIAGYLELLQEGETGELTPQQLRMLEVISRNTTRLRSLIEDVMVLSRIEGGVLKADFVGVSVKELIARVGEELRPLALGNDVELEMEPGPAAATVLGDGASLDRAVVNILANAIKFSRPGGVVNLRGTLDEGAGRVIITCQDHGLGIPARDQADLFTRFFRASNATERAIPGTGLGLSIARQIVEDHHGGKLRLTSVEEEGTTVVLDLPWYEPPPAEVDAVLPARGDRGNDSGADDVFDIRA